MARFREFRSFGLLRACLIAVVLIVQIASARAEDSTLRQRIPEWLGDYHVPAVGIAVIRDNEVAWADVFGERERGQPARRDTVFNVASLTKPVFAMMAMQLVARRELGLDDSLSPYWIDPDLASDERHRLLTPRIVLSHRTGFPNWRRDMKLAFSFDPGSRFGYSGEGFEYLKTAIERKTGRTMPELVRELVFKPAGMDATSFTWKTETEQRFAVGHDRQGRPVADPKRTDPSAADDLLTTIDDYARFAAWLLRGAGLPASLLRDLQTAQFGEAASLTFGLGWQIVEADELVLTHGGSDQGVRTETILLPTSRAGVVIFTNSDQSDPLIRRLIAETLGPSLDQAFGLAAWRMLELLPESELSAGVARLPDTPGVVDKVLQSIDARFLSKSALADSEKRSAREAFAEYVRGLVAGRVDKQTVPRVLAPVFRKTTDGWTLNRDLSPAAIQQLIDAARSAVAASRPSP